MRHEGVGIRSPGRLDRTGKDDGMADIGGIGGFNPATTRSAFDVEAAAERRAEEQQRQEELREQQRVEAQQEDATRTQETDTEQDAQASAQDQQRAEDQVTLSSAAQDFIAQQTEQTQAANDDAAIAATTQVGGVDGTNQRAADEENTSTVNGNQDDQSEQTRALGQIVDQFA